MSDLANTPKPPYYAVIFTSTLKESDDGYGEEANKMAMNYGTNLLRFEYQK